MSDVMGGTGEGAVGKVVAAKLRGARIWEGWVATVDGEGIYLYELKPPVVKMGKCSCGGSVEVMKTRGPNYLGTIPTLATLKLVSGCPERIIIVVPED